jgi:hypothetical protein
MVLSRCSALAQCHTFASDEKDRRITLRNRKKEVTQKSSELGASSTSRINAVLTADTARAAFGSKRDLLAAVGLLCDALGETVVSELPCPSQELVRRFQECDRRVRASIKPLSTILVYNPEVGHFSPSFSAHGLCVMHELSLVFRWNNQWCRPGLKK